MSSPRPRLCALAATAGVLCLVLQPGCADEGLAPIVPGAPAAPSRPTGAATEGAAVASAASESPVRRPAKALPNPRIDSAHEHLASSVFVDELLAAMDEVGVERSVLAGAYRSVLRQTRRGDVVSAHRNNLEVLRVAGEHPARFVPYVLMDGHEPDPVALLDEYLTLGAAGVKLYTGSPLHRSLPMDHPRLAGLFEYAERHRLPVLVHHVAPRYRAEIEAVLRGFPDLVVNIPHLMVDLPELRVATELMERYPNLHTDLSFGYPGWMKSNLDKLRRDPDSVRRFVRRFVGRVHFGSDMVVGLPPWTRAQDMARQLRAYRDLLEAERFEIPTAPGHVFAGLALDAATVSALYSASCAHPEGVDRTPDGPPRVLDDPSPAARGAMIAAKRIDAALVSAANPIDDISYEQLRLVLDGALGRWEELPGGHRGPVELAPPAATDVASWVAASAGRLAVAPLGRLDPRVRALRIDGVSPWDRRPAAYPLTVPLRAPAAAVERVRFRPEQVVTVVATGSSLYGIGMDYDAHFPADPLAPLAPVAGLLQAADLAHVSQETPIVADCAPRRGSWKWCSPPSVTDALLAVGVDVVEVTGNHTCDYGRSAFQETLGRYEAAGLHVFGGGSNRTEARAPLVVDVRGLRLAFLGYNDVSPASGLVRKDAAGGNPLVGHRLAADVEHARRAADVVMAHLQWGREFAPGATYRQRRLAHELVDLGVAAVVGTHGHRIQEAELRQDGSIFYGLGNFLFRDPAPQRPLARQAFALQHTFIGPRLFESRPLPLVLEGFVVRAAPPAEAAEILSRWRASSPSLVGGRTTYRRVVDLHQAVSGRQDRAALRSALRHNGIDQAYVCAASPGGNEAVLELSTGLPGAVLPVLRVDPGAPPTPAALEAFAARGYAAIRLSGVLPAGDGLAAVLGACGKHRLPVLLDRLRQEEIPALEALLARSGQARVVAPLFPLALQAGQAVRELTGRQPHLLWEISMGPPDGLAAVAASISAARRELDPLLSELSGRLLFGSGAAPVPGDGGSSSAFRRRDLVRAARDLLERESVRLPVFSHRETEWTYPYASEQQVPGLALPPAVLERLYWRNVSALFAQRRP